MKKPTDIGLNRTGIATSPIDSKETIAGAIEGTPEQSFDPTPIKLVRDSYAVDAPPVGTMPGNSANVLLDLLGERLAFERTGTRLYEALLTKREAAHAEGVAPTLAELESIRDDELEHFGLCVEAIEKLGGDPTVVTPSANIVAVASIGWMQVLCDPRTTLTEALKTILMAELTDNDGWEMLVRVANGMGQTELAARCSEALVQEQEHLRSVREWVNATLAGQAGTEAESESRPTP